MANSRASAMVFEWPDPQISEASGDAGWSLCRVARIRSVTAGPNPVPDRKSAATSALRSSLLWAWESRIRCTGCWICETEKLNVLRSAAALLEQLDGPRRLPLQEVELGALSGQ